MYNVFNSTIDLFISWTILIFNSIRDTWGLIGLFMLFSIIINRVTKLIKKFFR